MSTSTGRDNGNLAGSAESHTQPTNLAVSTEETTSSVVGEHQRISVEDNHQIADDHDSAFGDDENSSTYSTSLTDSIRNHVYENGRRYHSFREGTYLNPDDEDEQDRLDLQHHIWKMIQNGSVYTAPLDEPLHILDVGTGTGIWAIEIAEEFPGAEVIGTDISPIQPEWVPPNCRFYIDDAESTWVFKQQFDYIHGRALGGTIGDWKRFHTNAFNWLKPGGWLEMQEFEAFLSCDDDSMQNARWITSWTDEFARGSQLFGKLYNAAPVQKQLMEETGLVNIQVQVWKVPSGPWAKNKKLKELGHYMRANLIKSVDSYTPAMYTRVLGYSIEQTQITMEHIKQELNNKKLHGYARYYFVCGQKPLR